MLTSNVDFAIPDPGEIGFAALPIHRNVHGLFHLDLLGLSSLSKPTVRYLKYALRLWLIDIMIRYVTHVLQILHAAIAFSTVANPYPHVNNLDLPCQTVLMHSSHIIFKHYISYCISGRQ